MAVMTLPPRPAATDPAPALRDQTGCQSRCTRVLVVEDEPLTAEVFAQALKQDGHRVRIAKDGNQAIHALRDHPPDLVVLDMGVPTVPGAEVLRRLRASLRGVTVPVVVVSGSDRAQTGIDDQLLAPGRWITKPVRPADLAAIVRELLHEGDRMSLTG